VGTHTYNFILLMALNWSGAVWRSGIVCFLGFFLFVSACSDLLLNHITLLQEGWVVSARWLNRIWIRFVTCGQLDIHVEGRIQIPFAGVKEIGAWLHNIFLTYGKDYILKFWGWRKFCIEEPHSLWWTPNITRMIRSRWRRWVMCMHGICE
jgi:hypothetical protein